PLNATGVSVALAIPSGWFILNASGCPSFPCSVGTILSGATKTITTTLIVPSNATPSTQSINATATTTALDSFTANNSASVQTTIRSECQTPQLTAAAVVEVSTGSTYHVTWNDAAALSYELQE